MAIEIGLYRARIGIFSARASRNTNLPYALTVNDVFAMLSLVFIGRTKGLYLAVFCSVVINPNDFGYHSSKLSKTISSHSNQPNTDTSYTSSSFFSLLNRLLLLMSGNIHSNPGPTVDTKFNIVHINCRSLTQDKKILIEAESNKFDVITLSETWLKDKHSNQDLKIEGFHNIIRRDRPNNVGYGGVGIYIKSKHYCKHRPDLEVNNLEAVWIETNIDRKSFIIGSFYRSLQAT